VHELPRVELRDGVGELRRPAPEEGHVDAFCADATAELAARRVLHDREEVLLLDLAPGLEAHDLGRRERRRDLLELHLERGALQVAGRDVDDLDGARVAAVLVAAAVHLAEGPVA